MRLNPIMYVFEVTSKKFFGFIISQRGIEANPEKICVVLDLSPPRTIKKIQSLAGIITVLSQFISRLVEQCLPFFKALC